MPSVVAPPLLSVNDAVFPLHPLSGVLSLAREQQWQWSAPLLALESQPGSQDQPRLSYVQAREALLLAKHQLGNQLGVLSGARKALPQLSYLAAGMAAQVNLADALQFGLDFQLIAGAMVHLTLEQRSEDVALVACALFEDAELEDVLAIDHLATAVNAARQLCPRPFELNSAEFRLSDDGNRSVYEVFFQCPVRFGADSNQVTFDVHQLQQELIRSDPLQVALARSACEQELQALGVLGQQSLLQKLLALPCANHGIAQAAQALQLSPRSLHRLLAREGISYSAQSDRQRITRAKSLLQQGMDLEDIAAQLDYSDSRSLRRAFQRHTGLSPAAYRSGKHR